MKVFPADIDAVAQGFASVADVCAFAVEDPGYGENVAMAVVLDDSTPESIRGLHEWLSARLAEHKLPVRWYLLDEIPRSDRGKIDRRSVKRICEAQQPINLAATLHRANHEDAVPR
jgi:acyl-CoA synthetase (AMP-forming)/AMP-acid ligase II